MLKFKKDNGNSMGATYEGNKDIPIAFHLPDIGCPPDIRQKVLGVMSEITGCTKETIPTFILVDLNRKRINRALEDLGVVAEFRQDEVAIVKAPADPHGEYYADFLSA